MIAQRIPLTSSFIIAFLGLFITSPAFAQMPFDQVWLEPVAVAGDIPVFAPRNLIRKEGVVQAMDDRTIVFLPKNETVPVKVAASRVVWIEPGFEDAATIKAVEVFRSGNANQSISMLLEVIAAGPAVWRAQWLSMHLWQAAYQEKKYPATLELVKQIDALPLSPMILGGLPIHWGRERLPESAIDAARVVLGAATGANSKRSATNLVAASWLLNEPNETLAVEILGTLSLQSDRPVIAQLATVLLWRKALPPDVVANREAWNQRLAKMPLTLTPGPVFLAAERFDAAGLSQDALNLYLSVAITSARPHRVIAEARSNACDLLKQLNRDAEAEALIGTDSQAHSP